MTPEERKIQYAKLVFGLLFSGGFIYALSLLKEITNKLLEVDKIKDLIIAICLK